MYFQDIIFTLQKFWHENKCVILQPYDMEVGAGTSHPATTLKALDKNPWNTAYVQPCRRPADGRYGDNPNRTQHYYQFQVLLKPSPDNIQQLCIDSLEKLGINCKENDIRFIEDDWENPTLGAWGLGWEIWCNGMEVIQFTYMQQVGGIDCKMISGEITYGLERLAMYIQDKDSFWDLKWNSQGVTYKDIFLDSEKEYCAFNFEYADTKKLISYFADCEESVDNLIEKNLIRPAYDYCLKASHTFNLLDSRGVLSVAERVHFISKVRDMTKKCCKKWTEFY